jgi:hypothetical protein
MFSFFGKGKNNNKNQPAPVKNNRLAVNPYELGKELTQEHAPFYYSTDSNRYMPLANCYQYIPGVGNKHMQSQGINRNNVDTESELRNQTRIASYCPSKQYHPAKQSTGNCANWDQGLPCSCRYCMSKSSREDPCHNQIIPEHTRLDYIKPCNLPGVYINRFEPLCINVQDPRRIHKNSYIGMDSRNYVKDKFTN